MQDDLSKKLIGEREKLKAKHFRLKVSNQTYTPHKITSRDLFGEIKVVQKI